MLDIDDLQPLNSKIKKESPEKALVVAILDISIKDLTSKGFNLKIDAFDYFFSRTFELHCDLLGVPPCRLRSAIQDKLDLAMSAKAERAEKIKIMRETLANKACEKQIKLVKSK